MLHYLLPFCCVELSSCLSPEALEARLKSRIAPNPSLGERTSFGIEAMFWRLEGKKIPFWLEGTVAEGHVRIHRFVSGRNSFVPVLVGRIARGPTGSIIRVVARPDWFVVAFVAAWMSLAGLSGYSVAEGVWLPLLLAFAGPAIAVGAFVPQLIRVREDLQAFINPKEGEPRLTPG